MRKIKNLSLVLAFLFAVSAFAGCKKHNSNSSTSDDAGVTYEKSGYLLVDHGTSEYVVLLPQNPSENEYTAANELTYFLGEATQANIAIVNEGSYNVSERSAVISIGDTAYADQRGVKTDGSLDTSGYIMKTIDNQLFIRSDGNGLGCVYGVYDLLETSIGYRYYYTDEIYYQTKETVDLYKYDVVADPDFDFRAISTWNSFLEANEDYLRRTRTVTKDEGWAWGGEMHVQLRKGGHGVINKDLWYDAHKYGTVKEDGTPDHWFSESGVQLCWTAGEEMYKQAAEDIYQRIKTEPTKTYFGIGQADVTLFCNCSRCKQAKEDWALNDAGLQMQFINRVAHYVNEWVAKDFPGREIRLVIFAYYATETPPVKQDANGKWVPFSDKVIPAADNIDFYFAPIYTDYSKTLTDVENQDVYSNLLKWKDFLEGRKNQFLLYTYDTNFHHFFYNFNNFDTFREQAAQYAEQGVDFIHSQGANTTNQPCFQEMRYFVESQILWDTSKNYDDLVNEFMTHFYKDAAEEIRMYYDLTRMRYEQASVLNGMSYTTDIYSNIGDSDIWTEGVVDQIDRIFKKAYEKIDHYKTEDFDMYEKLYNRIKELELTLTYTKLKHYSSSYTQKEINALVDEFNFYTFKFDINREKEGETLTVGLFDNLKK